MGFGDAHIQAFEGATGVTILNPRDWEIFDVRIEAGDWREENGQLTQRVVTFFRVRCTQHFRERCVQCGGKVFRIRGD
jgi:hypothetical protein